VALKKDLSDLLTLPPNARSKSLAGYVLRAIPSDERYPIGRKRKAAKKAAKKTAKKSRKGRKS
jgi:hypothetical protein